MQPLISLRVGDSRRVWRPGEQLEMEYQIDAVSAEDLLAVEASILWYTEGKGDEDLAVLYFERRTAADFERRTTADFERRGASDAGEGALSGGASNDLTAPNDPDVPAGDLRELRKVSVTLPNSPLSYQGAIVKVRWCARVRAYLRGGKESFFECPFQLGAVPASSALLPSANDSDHEMAGRETWLVGSESRLANSMLASSKLEASKQAKSNSAPVASRVANKSDQTESAGEAE